MTTLRIALLALLLSAGAASAQHYNEQKVGPFGYINGQDEDGNAVRGTRQTIGNQEYLDLRDDEGNSTRCVTQTIGNQRYTNCY